MYIAYTIKGVIILLDMQIADWYIYIYLNYLYMNKSIYAPGALHLISKSTVNFKVFLYTIKVLWYKHPKEKVNFIKLI